MRKNRKDPLTIEQLNINDNALENGTKDTDELDFWNPIEDIEDELNDLDAAHHSAQQNDPLFESETVTSEPNDMDNDLSDAELFDTDEDDLFDDDDDPSFLFGSGRNRPHIGILTVSALIVLLLIVGGIYMFVSSQANSAEEEAAIALREEEALREQQQQAEARYDAIMSGKTFLPGITIEGTDVGGMTKMEAEAALQPLLAGKTPSGLLPLQFQGQSFSFDLSLIQATTNIDAVLDQAMQIAVSDDMETSLKKADEIAASGQNFTLTLQQNFDVVTSFVSDLAAQVNIPMKNAAIGTVDTVNHTVAMSAAVPGVSIKEAELVSMINNAVLTGSLSPITVPTETIEPTITDSKLSMIEIGAETSFKGSSSSRIYNIKKGAGLINGKILAPDEVFSTNDVLGVRSYKNGWKEANAYVGGTTEVQAGGGVCQLSSTLYNAVVKADLEVVTRRNHSMPVSYIKNGLDATINSVGNIIDFKFKNNTDCDLVVFAWTEGSTVHFKIIRCAFDTTEYDEIRLTAEKISTVYPDGEMEIIVDPMLAPGVEEIDVETKNGSIYQSYKNYYKDGEKVRSEKLAKSTYKAFNGSKRVGPSPSPSLTPIPAVTPSEPPITVITPVPAQTPTPESTTPSPTPIPETPTIVPETATPAPITPVPETPTPIPEPPMVTPDPATDEPIEPTINEDPTE